MEQYQGKHVIVTGGTGGIGAKVCRKLVKAGVKKIVIFKRAQDSAFKVKDQLLFKEMNVAPRSIVEIPLDFRDPTNVERKFQ